MRIWGSGVHKTVTGRVVATVIVLTTSTSACAGRRFDRLMQNWHGHRMPELLATWGPPRYAYSNGENGYVLAYVPAVEHPSVGNEPILASGAALADALAHRSVPNSQPVYAATITSGWRVFRLFFVDADGRIYRSEWKGAWACCGT
jgi:hypothetical protein